MTVMRSQSGNRFVVRHRNTNRAKLGTNATESERALSSSRGEGPCVSSLSSLRSRMGGRGKRRRYTLLRSGSCWNSCSRAGFASGWSEERKRYLMLR